KSLAWRRGRRASLLRRGIGGTRKSLAWRRGCRASLLRRGDRPRGRGNRWLGGAGVELRSSAAGIGHGDAEISGLVARASGFAPPPRGSATGTLKSLAWWRGCRASLLRRGDRGGGR